MTQIAKTQAQRRAGSEEKLIRSGFVVIAKNGLRSLSLAAVAEDATCSRELPRYIFGSKEKFVLALLADSHTQWDKALAKPEKMGLVGMDALFYLLDRFAEMYVLGDTEIMRGRMRLIFELAGNRQSLVGKKLVGIQASSRKQLSRVMSAAVSAGDFSATCDVESMATLLNCCYRGIGYQWVTNPDSIDVNAAFTQLRLMFVRTLTTPQSPSLPANARVAQGASLQAA